MGFMELQTDTNDSQAPYPGSTSSAQEIRALAGVFHESARQLLTSQKQLSPSTLDLAPFRLCALHAIELYLNAFLLAKGYKHEEIRAMQHNVAERAALAAEQGFVLRRKTAAHLQDLVENREYLVTRYDTHRLRTLSQLNRLTATLDEIAQKASARIQSE